MVFDRTTLFNSIRIVKWLISQVSNISSNHFANQIVIGSLKELLCRLDHHFLDRTCYSLDLDHCEITFNPDNKLVGIIQNCRGNYLLKDFEYEQTLMISILLDVPAFFQFFKGEKFLGDKRDIYYINQDLKRHDLDRNDYEIFQKILREQPNRLKNFFKS